MQNSLYFLILVLCFGTTLCWWEVGHMAVAQIAEKRLKSLG